ncbi:DoxX family protein [Microlunatus panaciterrae]|uniref:Membrane protein YphA (DoxX/SURF4 family) n=1 Tax=Microlunatus panaciterrae TaxID=400768 RepID=A0ABS2RFW9_9ACTN|nr:DoxX family protein [Microlunatus panaciterrae]MBM7797437.1 putative membrane protein YphA (DoxX/SURF4 family) [Microlunatus panaciterrae]
MTLLRALARPMLASYFVLGGAKALKDPQPFVAAAEPVAQWMVPMAKKFVPDEIVDKIPDDTATLVRINGALQLFGGLALASGKGRRLGSAMLAASLVPATLARHPFWKRTDPEEKAADKNHFMKNVALMGGVLIASADTEGKPSLVWRAHAGADALTHDTKRARKRVTKKGRRTADLAIAEGARVVEAVVRESRRAKKTAEREAKRAASAVERELSDAKDQAVRQAKTAKREARHATRAAKQEAKLIGKNIELGLN